MTRTQPLDDTWLFWNAERIEDFPHIPDDDYAGATGEGESEALEEEEQAHLRREMLAELLLYVGGASAAMAGVGLVILIASFISAYSALRTPAVGERAGLPEEPYLSLKRPTVDAQRPPPRSIVLEPAGSGTAPEGETSPTRGREHPRGAAAI